MDRIIMLSSRAQFEIEKDGSMIHINPLTDISMIVSVLERHYVAYTVHVNCETNRVSLTRCTNLVESMRRVMEKYPNADISTE